MAIYAKAMEVMEALIVKNEQVDLFSKLQQIVATLQLHFIMDYSLPAGWILVLASGFVFQCFCVQTFRS